MFRKAKVVAVVSILVAASGFQLYNAVFYGMTYVRRLGWRTYGEAPTAFIINTVLSCILLFAIVFVIWIRDGKREQALKRLPPPTVEESHVFPCDSQNTESSRGAKIDRS